MRAGQRSAGSPSHRAILAIAIPITISNVTEPLIGVVDTAVVGRLPDPAHIGAVAVGSLIFDFVYWGFGFLRMGTTGLTAQALGADDPEEIRASLGRALIVALGCGLALWVLQVPIRELAFGLVEGSAHVEVMARDYFDLRILSAPATFTNFAILGWLIGLGRASTALALSLVLNATNLLLDAFFVLELGWGVSGVATGTLIAQVVAALVGLLVVARHLRTLGGRWDRARLLSPEALRRTLAVNRDILVRNLALVSIFGFFTAQGAAHGDVVLAANAVLMHFVNVAAYFLDGMAFAAEGLVGKAFGARDPDALIGAARRTTAWSLGLAMAISLALAVFGPELVDLLTVAPEARAAAKEYLGWAVAAPVAGVLCFQLDGIFVGATRAAEMRNASLASLVLFLAGFWLLVPFDNHGLWGALLISYAARTLTLGAYLPRLLRAARAPPEPGPEGSLVDAAS